MAPHALPDPVAVAILMATLIALLCLGIGAVKMMIAGSVLGVLRSRLFSLPVLKAALYVSHRVTA